MIFRQLFDRESSTFTYLLGDPETGKAALIDTVREHVARDLDLVRELDLVLAAVVETHVHADHVTGAGELRQRTGATCYVSKDGGAPCADVSLADGDVVRVGNVELVVLATPGHTSGCVSYHWRGGELSSSVSGRGLAASGCVFTGDALLVRGCGRTDFQEGDAGKLWDSVHGRLFALPDATVVLPAHDYKGMTATTVGEEKRHNPRLGGARTRPEFVELMAHLNLPAPAKIAEALPANRACGQAT